MDIDECEYFFLPDNETVFKLVHLASRNKDQSLTVVDVESSGNSGATTKRSYQIARDLCIPAGSLQELEHPPDDLIKLQHVHRPGILHTLRSRFHRDKIYTSIGPILVALNPFKWIAGIYDEHVKEKYKSNLYNLSEQPHVFAVAHDAFSDLSYGKDQSLIISGESGAGKTEATKQALNYLAYIAGSSSGIQSKILNASPILEAWGNAKTLRNNNSSRFGKYIEIWFDGSSTIVGSSNTTYILEKSRVVFQSKDERNYHVFYQLLQGAPVDLLQQYGLQENGLSTRPNLSLFNYINQSGCIAIDDVDDADDYRVVNEAFADVGFTMEEQDALYRTIAGILHLGNIAFIPEGDESNIDPQTEKYFERCASMLGADIDFFRKALLFKKIKSGNARRVSIAFSPYTPVAANDNRDALAKEIYNRCFDWIVATINRLMFNSSAQAALMIGILDIFGFEIFQKNSFEQLCINLANEALQQHFNYNIFQAEMDIYLAEDVPVPQLDFKDNQDVLDLIIKRPKGLIPMLDEEGMVPKGSWEGFYSKFSKQYASHPRVKIRSKTNELGIVHYAGEVYYDPSLFLVKNKDTLSMDLIEILSLSSHTFIRDLFDEEIIRQREEGALSFRGVIQANIVVEPTGARGKVAKRGSSYETKQTVGRKFSLQMESLVGNLNATKPRYIRCIKPNQLKKPNIFVHHLTNEQLTYSGVFEAVIIMQNGYPFRFTHYEFYCSYHVLMKSSWLKRMFSNDELVDAFLKRSDQSLLMNNKAAFDTFCQEHGVSLDKKERKHAVVSDVSRECCNLLVRFMAESYATIDRTKFYVGITKTFYRANEHRVLREIRQDRLLNACILLQRVTRRYIASKLVRSIIANEHNAMLAIMQRALERLQQISQTLQEVKARIFTACHVVCYSPIVQIAADFAEALEKENFCTAQMNSIWSKTNMSDEDRYVQLFPLMEQAKSINFKANFKGKVLRLQWQENPLLAESEEKVRVLGLKVKVQKQFREGMENRNELLLEGAMEALNELRTTKVVDVSFCKEFEKDANTIINAAARQFDEILAVFQNALPQGRCTVKSSSDASTVTPVVVEVDPEPLKKVLLTGSKMKSTLGTLSKKANLLLQTCEAIINLRTAAKAQQWPEIQHLVTLWWQSQGKKDVLDTMTDVAEGRQLFLPPPIRKNALDEVRDLHIAAISSMLVPTFTSLLNFNAIPDTPMYNARDFIDSSSLVHELEKTKEFETYFDANLLKFIDTIKEHLFLRNAISSGNKTTLLDALNSIRLVSKSHPDYLNASKFKRMYVAMDKVLTGIIYEQWKGEPGSLQGQDMKVDQLQSALHGAQSIEVKGKDWRILLVIADALLQIRTHLKSNAFDESEADILRLQHHSMWKEINSKEHLQQLPVEVQKAVMVIEHELSTFLSELRHARAVHVIVRAFQIGAIPLQLEEPLDSVQYNSDAFMICLEENKPNLIRTAQTELLQHDCQTIARLREYLYGDQWDALGKDIMEIFEKTDEFSDCHEVCRAEFQALRDRFEDYNVHQSLLEVLVIQEKPLPVSNACQLLGAIIAASEVKRLSAKTFKTFLFAKALFCLRCVVRDGLWEPLELLFCGNVPTDELPAQLLQIEGKESKTKGIKDLKSLDRLVANLQEAQFPLHQVEDRIRSMELLSLSVLEILSWLTTISIPTICKVEIETIQQLSSDRRCQICLLIGAGMGKCHGSVDHLNHRLIRLDILKSALAFAEHHMFSWSKRTKNWFETARELVKIREVIVKTYTTYVISTGAADEKDEEEDRLHEVLNIADVERVIENAEEGYACEELRLILNRLYDLTAFVELSKAVSFGGPYFESGKFSLSRLQYEHIIERLDSARKLKTRSDRLDRLFFYLELSINLRKALAANEWELSESAGRKSSLDRTIVTVKRCLMEYQQALKFFRTPARGVPPQVLVKEFALVSREWDRKLLLQGFRRAYSAGMITGSPLALHFRDARSDLLEQAIKKIRVMEAESGEIDKMVQTFSSAAQELVDIRQQALAIHQSFKSPTSFSQTTQQQLMNDLLHPSTAMRLIVNDEEFIPNAIQQAMRNIEDLTASIDHHMRHYPGFERAVKKVKYALELPYHLVEVELVVESVMEQEFLVQVLPLLRNARMMLTGGSVKHSMLVSDLSRIIANFHHKQKMHSGNSNNANHDRKTGIKPGHIFDILYHSAIFLLHFYRAKVKENYDEFERDWKLDLNNSKTPHMASLIKHVDNADHSIQQLLRAANRLELHPVLTNALHYETELVEDKVSSIEIEKALTNYPSQGKVGNIIISDESVDYAWNTLERVYQVNVRVSSCTTLLNMLEVIYHLRKNVKNRFILEAIDVIKKYLQINEGNVDTILKTLFDAKDRKVMQIAEMEFKLLTAEACDAYWQIQAKEALLTGAIRGARGAILAHEVDPRPLNRVIMLATALRIKSKFTTQLIELCEVAMKIRILVSGMQVKGNTPVRERSRSIASLNSVEIQSFVEASITAAEQTVEKISSLNWPTTFDDKIVDQIKFLTNQVQSIVDYEVMNKCLDPQLKDFVINESKLLLQHYTMNAVSHALHHILDGEYLQLTKQGLTMSTMYNALELAVNQGTKEKFSFAKPNENWCHGLNLIATAMMKLLKSAASVCNTGGSSGNEVTLHPGTTSFDRILPAVYYFIKVYSDFKYHLERKAGFQKHAFPPLILESTLAILRSCCIEHVRIRLLCRISKSENIILFEDEDGRIQFKVKRIDAIPLLVAPNSDTGDEASSYHYFAQKLTEIITNLSFLTMKGNKLKDYVIKLITFRDLITQKRWHQALNLTKSIEPIEGFNIYTRDVDYFHIHINIINAQRALEYYLLLCILPSHPTWSLHENALDVCKNLGGHLERFMRSVVDGSGTPLPKFKIFEELSEIAQRLIDLLFAIKKGRFINLSDLTDNNPILTIARHLGDDIHFSYPHVNKQDDQPLSYVNHQESVYACLVNFTNVIQRSQCIETYLKQHLQREINKIREEIKVVQLEYLASYTFRLVRIGGSPGELTISSDTVELLNLLIDFFEMHKGYIQSCLPLKQSYLTAKILLKFCKAQKEHDLHSFEQLLYLLDYLDKYKQDMVLQLISQPAPPESVSTSQVLSMEEILILQEEDYQRKFSKTRNDFVSQAHVISEDQSKNQPKDWSVSMKTVFHLLNPSSQVDDVYNPANTVLAKFTHNLGHAALTELPRYRREMKETIIFIKRHFLFELMYKQYLLAMKDKPASGQPGELTTNVINVDLIGQLAQILTDSHISELSNECKLLDRMTRSIFSIRKGQLENDIQLIEIGLEIVQEAKELENLSGEVDGETPSPQNSPNISNISSSSKKSKQKIFVAITRGEIALAEADLEQKRLILQLEFALSSQGCPTEETYPFDLTGIETDDLLQVCEICETIIPTCSKAIQLHKTATIILSIRKKLQERKFMEVIETVMALFNEESNDFPDVASNQKELLDSWRVSSLTQAIEKTNHAFSEGVIQGKIDYIYNPELVDRTLPQEAFALYKFIRKEWKDDTVKMLENSCESILNIRTLFKEENYQTLYDLTSFILENLKSNSIKLAEACLEEVQLANVHAAYAIVTNAFEVALTSSRILGDFGHLSHDELSLIPLEEAFALHDTVGISHGHISILRRSAELIYRIRKAQLLNRWIHFNVKEDKQKEASAVNALTSLDILEMGPSAYQDYLDRAPNTGREINEEVSNSLVSVDDQSNQFTSSEWMMKFITSPFKDNEYVENILEDFDNIVRNIYDHKTKKIQNQNTITSLKVEPISESMEEDSSHDGEISQQEEEEDHDESYLEDVGAMSETGETTDNDEDKIGDSYTDEHLLSLENNENLPVDATNEINASEPVDASTADSISCIILDELKLARNEVLFRQIIAKVFIGIHSAGYKGTPGSVEDNSIDIGLLEEALIYASFFNFIATHSQCKGLLRDAKLLLDARKCRLNNDFIQLNEIVSLAEDHNALVFQSRTQYIQQQKISSQSRTTSASLLMPFPGMPKMKKAVLRPVSELDDDYLEPITAKVWEELKLLKYDALFNIVLCEFSEEMRKEELLTRRASVVLDGSILESVDLHERIYKIESLLEFSKNAVLQFPSAEFDRLIEALYLGLQLRRFVRDEPNKSPQMIIDQVAKVKKRDHKKGLTSYVGLLIFEISKMSNVLDFPVLLEKIRYEIVHGQKYLDYPIGMIPYDKIDLRAMITAYDAALPSLEIMGTDENQSFMKLAHTVIELRKALKEGDLSQAMKIAITHEHILKDNELVKEEIKRLRVEMENYDAGKLIAYGLKTGRYLDVIAIAKMKSVSSDEGAAVGATDSAAMDMVMAKYREELTPTSHSPSMVQTPILGSGRRSFISANNNQNTGLVRRRRSTVSFGQHSDLNGEPVRNSIFHSRRVSQGIADMMAQFESLYLVDAANEQGGSVGDSSSAVNGQHNPNNTSSQFFVGVVQNSIYALKRAVAVASRVSVKSDSTVYFLNAAKVILELREAIVNNRWEAVVQLVQRPMNLPPVALEEVNAVREGLCYQRCLETVAESLTKGNIRVQDGAVHDIKIKNVLYSHIMEVVAALQSGGFQDSSILSVIELAKRVIHLRHTFLVFAGTDIVLADGQEQLPLLPPIDMNLETDDADVSGRGNILASIEAFRKFEERKLHELFVSLGLLMNPNEQRRSSMSSDIGGRNRTNTLVYSMNSSEHAPPGDTDFNSLKLKPSQYYWVSDLVDAIVVVKQEIETIESILQYRETMFQMILALDYPPLALARYLKANIISKENIGDVQHEHTKHGNQHRHQQMPILSSLDAIHRIDANLQHLSELQLCRLSSLITTNSGKDDESTIIHTLAKIVLKGDIYLVEYLQTAIDIAERYNFIYPSPALSNVLLTLQTILQYRLLLNRFNCANAVSDDNTLLSELTAMEELKTWLDTAKQLVEGNKIYRDYGRQEIEAYRKVAQETIENHSSLLQAIQSSCHFCLPVYAFSPHEHLQLQHLEEAIDRIKPFLHQAGGLSIGLASAVSWSEKLVYARRLVLKWNKQGNHHRQGKEIHDLLEAIRWELHASHHSACTIYDQVQAELSYLLAWTTCECQLISAFNNFVIDFPLPVGFGKFATLMDFLNGKVVDKDWDGIMVSDVDISNEQEFFRLFGENLGRALARVDDLMAEIYHEVDLVGIQLIEEDGIETRFLCSLRQSLDLWRDLLQAVGRQDWLPGDWKLVQLSKETYGKLDSLLRETFPISSSDNKISMTEDQTDQEQGRSVLEVLCQFDWDLINHHKSTVMSNSKDDHRSLYTFYGHQSVLTALSALRNFVLEVYLRQDLLYYVNKGMSAFDAIGNLTISDLYCRLLGNTLRVIDKIRKLASRKGIALYWSREFANCLQSARLVHALRSALLDYLSGPPNRTTQRIAHVMKKFVLAKTSDDDLGGCLDDLIHSQTYDIVHNELITIRTFLREAQGESVLFNVVDYLQQFKEIDDATMDEVLLPKAFRRTNQITSREAETQRIQRMYQYLDKALYYPVQSLRQERILLFMQTIKNMILSAKKGITPAICQEVEMLTNWNDSNSENDDNATHSTLTDSFASMSPKQADHASSGNGNEEMDQILLNSFPIIERLLVDYSERRYAFSVAPNQKKAIEASSLSYPPLFLASEIEANLTADSAFVIGSPTRPDRSALFASPKTWISPIKSETSPQKLPRLSYQYIEDVVDAQRLHVDGLCNQLVERMVLALCEMIYCLDEPCIRSILLVDDSISKIWKPMSVCTQSDTNVLPLEVYRQFWFLFAKVNELDSFVICRPHWAVVLLLIINFLRMEIAKHLSSNQKKSGLPASFKIPSLLCAFLRDLKLSRYLQPTSGPAFGKKAIIRSAKTIEGFYPEDSPSLLILTEYLSLTRRADGGGSGCVYSPTNNRQGEKDSWLKLAAEGDAVFVDPDNTIIPGHIWLRHHMQRLKEKCSISRSGDYEIGLPARSSSMLSTLAKALA